MNKKVFLIVDTDTSWIPKFKKRLHIVGLDSQFVVREVFPDTSLSDQMMVDHCVTAIATEIEHSDVAAIFVDIVIKEEGDLDALGISIASAIRVRWPEIPLFNVTGKLRGDEEQELFSEATIEDVDGVLAKVFLWGGRASAERFRQILDVGKRRNREEPRPVTKPILIDPKGQVTRQAFGADELEARVKMVIDDVGEDEFWGLLGLLLPHAEGTLSVINPGRSGAFVLKAAAKFSSIGRSPTRATTWIIKMARDSALLQRELDGYRELGKTPLLRNRYPKLFTDEVKTFGGIGGLAIGFEGQGETLLDFFAKGQSVETGKAVVSNLRDALADLYGDPIKKVVRPWSKFYSFNTSVENKILGFLRQSRGVLVEFLKEEQIKRLESFVMTQGRAEPKLYFFEGEISTAYLHGDLNARNILITDSNDVVLLDFASRRQGHILADMAKLERDLLLRVVDWETKEFYDWDRISAWKKMAIPVVSLPPDERWVEDLEPEHQGIGECIRGLRALAPVLGCSFGPPEYGAALSHFLGLGALLPELSMQKKVFAAQLINRVLEDLS